MSSIEEVQEVLDSLLLEFFESARGHEKLTDNASCHQLATEKSEKLIEIYNKLQTTIINLKGIDKTKEEQLAEIESLTLQHTTLKASVLSCEQQLRDKVKQIDSEIEAVR